MPSEVMPFEARIYIQGVGVYVPDKAKSELLVLFPDEEKANAAGFRDIDNRRLRRHHAVLQFDPRDVQGELRWDHKVIERLEPGNVDSPPTWVSCDLRGKWLSFLSDSCTKARLFTGGGGAERVRGVPYLPDVLEQAGLGRFAELVSDAEYGTELERLKAGLKISKGVLSPAVDYTGKFRFDGFGEELRGGELYHKDRDYTSVLKLELEAARQFTLSAVDFSGGRLEELEFEPRFDDLEIWVRHYCDVDRRPGPDRFLPRLANEADVDFVLNYALLEDAGGLREKRGRRLPVPKVSVSWERGSPIGGDPSICMGTSGKGNG